MKRATILFVVLFLATMLVPMISLALDNSQSKENTANPLVTIFDNRNSTAQSAS